MPMSGRASLPEDREEIIDLFLDAFGPGGDSAVRNEAFARWKYWGPHPLAGGSRGHVIDGEGRLAAHGCVWPIRLLSPEGELPGFHLIDWAARRDVPGAGMQVFRQTCAGMSAAFSIGGSAMTRKILPAFGFKPFNTMYFLARPLAALEPAFSGSPKDWKMPARLARNLAQSLVPVSRPPAGWTAAAVEPRQISAALWPAAADGRAVSRRSPDLLEHAMGCPTVLRSGCWAVQRGSGLVAYFLLVQVRDQVRLADYGPLGLDIEAAQAIGAFAQKAAKSMFPGANTITAATSEAAVRSGLLESGMRLQREEAIKALKKDKRLMDIQDFRLTLLDWDSYCL